MGSEGVLNWERISKKIYTFQMWFQKYFLFRKSPRSVLSCERVSKCNSFQKLFKKNLLLRKGLKVVLTWERLPRSLFLLKVVSEISSIQKKMAESSLTEFLTVYSFQK
jgi:hypothetical protein